MTRLWRALVALSAISLLGFATGILGPLPAAASSRGDGGLPPGTWHQQNSTTSETLFGVSCASVTNCVAVGGDGTTFSPEPGITLHTTDGGQSWTKQTWGTLATLRGVSCVAGTQTCLAVGTDVQGGVALLLQSTDSGTTWMTRTAPSSAGVDFLAVGCMTDTSCVAFSSSHVIATNDAGTSWTTRPAPTRISAVSCPSTSVCYAVGQRGIGMWTTDAGATWTVKTIADLDLLSISCGSLSTCAAGSDYGRVLDTANSGKTWARQLVNMIPYGMSCADGLDCVAVGPSDTLAWTTNGGGTWSNGSTAVSTYYQGVSCPLVSACMAVGQRGVIVTEAAPSNLAAAPATVAADGTSASRVTVTIRDALGRGAAGKSVTLSQSAGPGAPSIAPALSVTDSKGQASFLVKSTAPGTDTFAAQDVTDSVAIGSVSIKFVAHPFSAASTAQYVFHNSDGATWTDVDPADLALVVSASVSVDAIISGNSDLWTAQAGYNQDFGVAVSGGSYPSITGQPEAWKESGGFAGTYSPNAGFVQTVIRLQAGIPYHVSLQWKTNKPAYGSWIYAGAGPISGRFSPTQLTVQLIPVSSNDLVSRVSTAQYQLFVGDGSHWANLDDTCLCAGSGLNLDYQPNSDGIALVNGNADLWTSAVGVNQDLGINLNGQVVAWKESGGFAGTFSPNAAFVQTAIPMTAGSRNHIALQWKSNIRISGQAIYAGAGPIGSQFSPTRLTLSFLPNPPNLTSAVSTTQDTLTGSDGVSWQLVDPSLNVQVTPPANCLAVISGNADLWTADRGYNQDLGIGVTGGSYPTASNQPEAWKESGGFAGTNSPNAAFVQTVLPLLSQTTYTIGLVWKTNIPAAAASIYVGAGDPRSGQFSPTALHVELICP